MGRLRRAALAALMGSGLALQAAGAASAFDSFGAADATSTYGEGIRFTIEYGGAAPDQLELRVRTPSSDSWFVTPVTGRSGGAEYTWDTSIDHVTPNTLLTYQWRAVEDGRVTTSSMEEHRYVDDRPGLDWRHLGLGDATVHWYGSAESTARRFGELTAVGVAQAEELLGTRLAGPVDVFVYDDEADFFGALGPGAREWTGAAAFSNIRTIFMWLGGGSPDYLEQAMVHEVTHIVFHDATANAFHEPARWLNEGIATWSESRSDAGQSEIVQDEAAAGSLFAFEAISEQFPIGSRGAILSYAQGTTMVELIVDRYGTDAIAAIMAAYRDGASDAEALEAGTGVPADRLYADYFASFGVEAPRPVVPEPILPSDVDRPTVGNGTGVRPSSTPSPLAPGDGGGEPDAAFVILLAIVLGVAVVAGITATRRGRGRDAS